MSEAVRTEYVYVHDTTDQVVEVFVGGIILERERTTEQVDVDGNVLTRTIEREREHLIGAQRTQKEVSVKAKEASTEVSKSEETVVAPVPSQGKKYHPFRIGFILGAAVTLAAIIGLRMLIRKIKI